MGAERYDRHFLALALANAGMSKDPNTRVGAIIVGPDREIRSAGFNGLPRGIADTHERLHDRDTKMKLVVHGEMNAVLNAARAGISTKGCTLYLAATDDSGVVWGGPPCTRCTVEMIQAGITDIVSYPVKGIPSRWHDDLVMARALLREAKIGYREIAALGAEHGHGMAAAATGSAPPAASGVSGAADEVRCTPAADAGRGAAVVAEMTACPRCRGAGRLPVAEPECNGGVTSAECEMCGGSGRVA